MNVFFTFSTRLVAFTFLAALLASPAHAQEDPNPLKGIAFESLSNGVPEETFIVREGEVELISMSIPGRLHYAFNKKTNGFFIKLPDAENIYGINLVKRVQRVPEAIVEKVGPGLELLGYKTTQWRVYSLGQLCGDVFTSTDAAQNLGFNFAHQIRIQQGVAEAFSKEPLTNNKCENFVVKPALGEVMGTALAFSGRMGEGRVTNIIAYAELPKKFIRPLASKKAKPITEDARKEVFLSAMPAHSRSQMRMFLKNQSAEEGMKMLLKMRELKKAKEEAE